ncbi:MAG: COX15/CtaA family protein [Magnetovibrio sp.]|nr:COX15/CtaA family protein [Magnetovibrio sp.]
MATWLFTVAGMVLFMVILGGLTRLTHSGLSIVEWKLFTGWVPPLNEADWEMLFAKYQNFPEFHKTNPDMDVQGFKGIFWLEFIHRVWGRLLGFAFFLPFAVFMMRGWVRVSDGLFWKLVGLLALGGSQGVMGWFMVMSGLVDRPDVSQYRLTAHFGLALLIIIALIWVALNLLNKDPYDPHHQDAGILSGASKALFLLAFITALSGGFVAGLDAGFAYNTFPLMDGGIVPGGLFDYDPWYMAPFEDITTVQFDHRTLAESTFVVIMIIWYKSKSLHLAPRARRAVHALGMMACVQVALGISTLLLVVPVSLASLHQIGAVVLLSIATWCMHELRSPNR